MNIKILILSLISISANAQLEKIRHYETKKQTDSSSFYKINGKLYETDHSTFFLHNKNYIYKKTTNDIIHLMIYKKKYLFVGHYPNTPEEIRLPFAYEDRLLNRLSVIDLENPSKNWNYQFDEARKMNMKRIKSFDPKDGDIVYSNHMKPITEE